MKQTRQPTQRRFTRRLAEKVKDPSRRILKMDLLKILMSPKAVL